MYHDDFAQRLEDDISQMDMHDKSKLDYRGIDPFNTRELDNTADPDQDVWNYLDGNYPSDIPPGINSAEELATFTQIEHEATADPEPTEEDFSRLNHPFVD